MAWQPLDARAHNHRPDEHRCPDQHIDLHRLVHPDQHIDHD